jgi:hypothetical protein
MKLIRLLAAAVAGAAALVLRRRRRTGRLRLDRARAALRLTARGGARYAGNAVQSCNLSTRLRVLDLKNANFSKSFIWPSRESGRLNFPSRHVTGT